MPRALAFITFLGLIGEDPSTYAGLVSTPLAHVEELLFAPSSLKLPLFTYLELAILVLLGGAGQAPRMRARPMTRAMLVSLACVALWIALGTARGGQLNQSGFQVFPFLNALLFAFVLMAALRTPQHYAMLLGAIVAAAAYRAAMAVIVYAFIVRQLPWDKAPEYITSHHDTVLFVTAVIILLVGALERVTPAARSLAWLLVPLILVAVQLNNRRLAWVSLVGGLVAAYAVYPPSAVKRRGNRAVACAIPVIALYMTFGWGRTERVFKPLAALSSVGSHDDMSTRSRDNENDGLIYTFGQNGVLGTGFGHEYIETDTTLSARSFPQYRFMPHNSVLGLLAFTGPLGLAGILFPLPMSVFLNARTARAASAPLERMAAVVYVAVIAVCLNQMYGDMGFGSRTTLTILAMAFAGAGRLSTRSGAWPVGAPPRRA